MTDYNDYININTAQTLVDGGDAGINIKTAVSVALNADDGKCVITGYVGQDGTYGDYNRDYLDYYSFVPLETGDVTISLTGLEGYLYLHLAESDGHEFGTGIYADTNDKTLYYSLIGGETYYVAVDSYQEAQSRYDLVIDTLSVEERAYLDYLDNLDDPDDYEDYVNGDSVLGGDAAGPDDKATPVVLDGNGRATITGTVGYGNDDLDYYTFTVAESGQLEVDLTDLRASIFTRLYSGGIELETTLADNFEDKHLVYDVDGGKIYTVVVDPYYSAESPYVLTINAPPDDSTVPVNVDDSSDFIDDQRVVSGGDVADSKNGAAEIPLTNNHTAISAAAGFDGDMQDWYTFDVSSSAESITVTLSGLSDELSMTLYDSSDREVWTTTTDQAATKSESLTSGDTYYLAVSVDEGAASRYNISVDAKDVAAIINQDLINGDIVDGNDAAENAVAATLAEPDFAGVISINGYVSRANDSADWYSFVAPTGGEIVIDWSGSGYFYHLRDSDENIVMTAYVDNGKQTIPLTAGEAYFIDVVPALLSDYNLDHNYNLELTGFSISAADTLNDDPVPDGDAGDLLLNATDVVLDGADITIAGTVGLDDHADFYHVVLPATQGNLTLDLSDFTGILSVVEDGQVVGQISETVSYNFAGGETVDLIVTTDGVGESDYVFALNLEEAADPEFGTDKINGDTVGNGDAGNSLETIVPVNLDSTKTISGTVGDGDDPADYYQVTLPDLDGILILDLTNFAATLSVDLGTDQPLVLTNDMHTFSLDGGTYNLFVTPADLSTASEKQAIKYVGEIDNQDDMSIAAKITDYDFSLIVNTFAAGADVLNGNLVDSSGDAGDAFASETSVTFDNTDHADIHGSVGFTNDAGDFYQLRLDESGIVNVALSGIDQTINALLFNSDEDCLGAVNLPAGESIAVDLALEGDESYTIVIDPFPGSETAYHLAFAMA